VRCGAPFRDGDRGTASPLRAGTCIKPVAWLHEHQSRP
jgi:hypothetical protein